MTVRPIKPEEKITARKIQNLAFLLEEDFSGAVTNPEEYCKGYETTRAAFDDRGKMCSCLELLPYTVMYDGHMVAMGGIGGVATHPEDRKKGGVRSIFQYCMQEMYDEGYVFSYLYPFSHPFYRRFGYELNMTRTRYSIPLSSLAHFSQTGSVRLYTKDMDCQPLVSVYGDFIKDKNLAVVRDEYRWKRFFSADPYKDNVYIYLWYNQDDVLRGYLKHRIRKTSEYGYDLIAEELVWLDTQAFEGIMAFVRGLSAQFSNLIWECPSFFDLLSYFPEPYDIGQEIMTNGMNRVVNARRALELISPPQGSGSVVIQAADAILDANTARYCVSWDKGEVEVKTTDREADLVCGIKDLGPLVTGFATPAQLKEAGRIEINGKADVLEGLFPRKKLYINDRF
ncbi:MAG TPA: GNAT family N-acetyltransferase [Candidatus Atribacteria bacterium]|nr:GNAT family N-acetyltransferase [Candidatus Atribacteria bacterium]HPT78170.1 GNAT family N-acetyltransferase [Candidatus Atribacteria bacterium]